MMDVSTEREARGKDERERVCSGCSQEHACREVWAQESRGPFSGGGLCLAAVTAFLLPLGTAVGGAVLARTLWGEGKANIGVDLLGALAGLFAGGLTAWVIVNVMMGRGTYRRDEGEAQDRGEREERVE